MVKEGYLVKYESLKDAEYADLIYAKFEDGILRYFDNKDGKWLGEHKISGKALKVELLDDVPERLHNRFCVVTQSIIPRSDALYYGEERYLEFSAATPDEQLDWGNAIHLWKRSFWKPTNHPASKSIAKGHDCHDRHFQALKAGLESKNLHSRTAVGHKLRRRSSYKPVAVTFQLPPTPLTISPMPVQQTSLQSRAVQAIGVSYQYINVPLMA